MRLFIAISLSPELQSALLDVRAQLEARGVAGRFTPPENCHLTLAFIGEYPDPDAVPLPPVAPFPLTLEGLGAFGDLWWVGVERSDPLERCVRRLREALTEAGIPFDRKRFNPHITLARWAAGRPVAAVPHARMTVDHISLMRSDRGPRGMVYTELRRSAPWPGSR